jgi:hypothetical protein
MSEYLMVERRVDVSLAVSNRAVVIFLSLLLFLPSALMATALRPVPASLVIVGSLGALMLVARRTSTDELGLLDQPLDLSRLSLCVALAVVLLMLGGEGHLFFAPLDWRIRDGVLADLSQRAFPIVYEVDAVDYVLRAPLGMYMIPGAIGRMFGLVAADFALLAQNGLFLGAMFYILGQLGRGWPHILIMIFFTGLPLVGIALIAALSGSIGPWEHFITYGFDNWNGLAQYPANLTALIWAPNHALPGWWMATLVLLRSRGQIDTASALVSIAGAIFWSPLAVIPAAIWLTLIVVARLKTHLRCLRTWQAVLAGMCFVPIAWYLIVGSFTIRDDVAPQETTRPLVGLYFWILYVLFMLTQMIYPAFILASKRFLSKELRILFLFCTLILAVLPFFHFGPCNDLAMRSSIMSYIVISFIFGDILLNPQNADKRRVLIGWLLVASAAPSGLLDLFRAATHEAYPISDCSLIETNQTYAHARGRDGVPTHYVVESAMIPVWLMNSDIETAAKNVARDRKCWTDQDQLTELLKSRADPFKRGTKIR